MFHFPKIEVPDAALTAVQLFLAHHGQDLADAALQLGGAAAEARVINCVVHLQDARRLDPRSRRDLRSFHRLLSLQPSGDLDAFEEWFGADLDPKSSAVEAICLLTDRLTDLLVAIGEPVEYPEFDEPEDLIGSSAY